MEQAAIADYRQKLTAIFDQAAASALKAHKKRQAEHRLSIGLNYHSQKAVS